VRDTFWKALQHDATPACGEAVNRLVARWKRGPCRSGPADMPPILPGVCKFHDPSVKRVIRERWRVCTSEPESYYAASARSIAADLAPAKHSKS